MLDIIDFSIKHMLVLLELIALVFCIRNFKKLGIFRPYFIVYLVGFLQCSSAVFFDINVELGGREISLSFALISLFLFSELLANSLVYLSIFKNRSDLVLISILVVLQSANIFQHFYKALLGNYDHTFLFICQSIVLILLTARIIQREFRNEYDSTPQKSPILFFAFSTFFFCLFTLPIYLFHDYALHNYKSVFGYLYIINDVAYIIYTLLILTSLRWMRNSSLSA